jgi:dienelactone hydrolase
LEGFATLIVDSPGFSWDSNEQNERIGIGDHDDWFASMGRPLQGVYAWDLMRGLDYLQTRSDMDCKRVGITGTSGGGTATMYTFALDERISCAVPVCYATSMEVNPDNGCLCNHVPGIMALGDRSDILAMRAPAPVMLIGATRDAEFPPEGHQRTFEKLKAIYRSKKKEANVRLELVEGGHDYSRRMRESMVAFFREHILGEPSRSFVAEKRPLTDGGLNPFEVGTLAATDPRLMVTTWFERETTSMRDLLEEALGSPQPSPYDPASRLIGWGRHGRIEKLKTGENVSIHDLPLVAPRPDSIALAIDEIDQRLCIYIGLSIPEFYAQWLHTLLPSGPEGWEASRTGNMPSDPLTSMIASVRTLVSSANPEVTPTHLDAAGPIASMTAQFLKLYRPSLEITTSHTFTDWKDALNLNIRQLAQPQARYLEWPWPKP